MENIISIAPPPPSTVPTLYEDKMYWLHTKKSLDAAEAVLHLYALPIPILQHSPLSILGMPLCILAYLSACKYFLQGDDWYRARDRIRLGLGGLKKMGEVWALGRQAEKEIKQIARGVFQLQRPESQVASGFQVDYTSFDAQNMGGLIDLDLQDLFGIFNDPSALNGMNMPEIEW